MMTVLKFSHIIQILLKNSMIHKLCEYGELKEGKLRSREGKR